MANIFSEEQIKNKDIDTLKRWLRYKLGGYVVAIRNIRTDNIFYRGVRHQRRPRKISDVSYPPPDEVKKYGRANRVGQPMFYGCRGAPGVFYELRAKQGDLIAVSEWGVTESLWIHHLGYHPDTLQRLGRSDGDIRQSLTNPIPNETKKNIKVRRQLSLAFTEDVPEGNEYRYKQSIAIHELNFDGASPLPQRPGGPTSDKAAGTAYPAMRMRGVADNVAIWPEFVDSSLRIKSVRYVLVESAEEAKSSYSFRTVAISHSFSGDDIVWQESLPPEKDCRSRISFENGNWVLRDGYDQIYDLH